MWTTRSGNVKKIEDETEWVCLEQGEALFHQGDSADCFFLLISGRLQAVVQDNMGNEKVVGEVRRGESVGEMAMFTGERRSASIYAIRNSELVKFSKEAFERIIALFPKVMMRMTQLTIERLQSTLALPQKPVDEFKMLDFKALEQIVNVGYEYAKQELEGWKPPYKLKPTYEKI